MLDIGRDVKRPNRLQREPVFLAPVKELVTGPRISQPGIPVPDRRREEFNRGIGSLDMAIGGDAFVRAVTGFVGLS